MANSSMMETADDIRLVKESVLLPVVMDVLEADIKTLGETNLKMSMVYVEALKNVQQKVIGDMYNNRQHMRKNGIKIIEQQRSKESLSAKYLCRGYQHDITLLWGLVKSEVQIMILKYLDIENDETSSTT